MCKLELTDGGDVHKINTSLMLRLWDDEIAQQNDSDVTEGLGTSRLVPTALDPNRAAQWIR
jgi:hypothetical protein